VQAGSSRAGSVPAAREASVKIEEGTESGADVKRRSRSYTSRRRRFP
jgi:hypothetical protein